jgi:hypothetical protein
MQVAPHAADDISNFRYMELSLDRRIEFGVPVTQAVCNRDLSMMDLMKACQV